MSTNTDNSGSARAARLRRIAASGGPTPAVRPNLGSQALDARLGKAECCPPCNPEVQWVDSPITLDLIQKDNKYYYSAEYATVTSTIDYGLLFGPPPGIDTTTYASRDGNTWTVEFVSSTPLTSFDIVTGFVFNCSPTITIQQNITFNVD